jgi:hypothetical protein
MVGLRHVFDHRLDHRRSNRAFDFFVALDAAMVTVIADVAAAREMLPAAGQTGLSREAYAARQRIRKSMFSELRAAVLRLGDHELTGAFISLDNQIDNFAAKWQMDRNSGTGFVFQADIHAGFDEQLAQIELAAKKLRDEAGPAIERCRKVF